MVCTCRRNSDKIRNRTTPETLLALFLVFLCVDSRSGYATHRYCKTDSSGEKDSNRPLDNSLHLPGPYLVGTRHFDERHASHESTEKMGAARFGRPDLQANAKTNINSTPGPLSVHAAIESNDSRTYPQNTSQPIMVKSCTSSPN